MNLPPRKSIGWYNGKIRFIDQTLLPHKLEVIETDDWRVIEDAIKRLAIRGAPLIGVAAAVAVAATAEKIRWTFKDDYSSLLTSLTDVIDTLERARPTAVNLSWALERMRKVLTGTDHSGIVDALVAEAIGIMEDDTNRCAAIGRNGAALIADGDNVLTICNTGYLATAGDGTALSIFYHAHDTGKDIHVFAPETRPLLQGARLTAWELQNAGISVTLLVDSAVGSLLSSCRINCCIIGADRIAANGDTANKIGSYQLALICKAHNVPYYVAAPWSTIDPHCPDGHKIVIEHRNPNEVRQFNQCITAPPDVEVYNPAFDVVPAGLITGIITEKQIYKPNYNFSSF